jgi:hypothetical protein
VISVRGVAGQGARAAPDSAHLPLVEGLEPVVFDRVSAELDDDPQLDVRIDVEIADEPQARKVLMTVLMGWARSVRGWCVRQWSTRNRAQRLLQSVASDCSRAFLLSLRDFQIALISA